MDPIKILKRAWQILWSYRALWVFGLILALAGAGLHARSSSSGTPFQSNPPSNPQQVQGPEALRQAILQVPQILQTALDQVLGDLGIPKADLPTLITIAVIFILFCIVLGVIVSIARYVAETAVIRMVDEYESTGSKMSIRQGFKLGWSRTSWRLFLINLLVNLPIILAVILMLAVGVAVFMNFVQGNGMPAMFMLVGSVILLFVVLFVVGIISIFLGLLRNFFWRACALENIGVRESLRRGFQMVRENWKNVGIMWVVMIGLGIGWLIVLGIAMILTLPVVVVTGVAGVLVAVIPALLAGGITSLFLHGWLPWIVGALFAFPLFAIVAFSPWLLLSGWQTVFASTVWTLVYRELKTITALKNGNEPARPASN